MLRTKLVSLLVLATLFAVLGGFFWVGSYLHRPLASDMAVVVEVPAGGTLSGLMRDLSARGLLGDGMPRQLRRVAVKGFDLFTGVSRRMHVGEYRIEPGQTLIGLLGKLERGDVLQRSFTLIEGWNIRELRAALQRAEGLVIELVGVDDEELMKRLERPGLHPEGWFAPDTYFYTAGESDLDLLRRALLRQENILQELWQERAVGLPYREPYDALIMASIVEKETGVPYEREEIAGVFVQRLQRGMRLQTDPTVIYGMGARYDGNIRRRDLQEATPYNTYVIRGMPPTPIAMPGKEAIQAALHPADTDALFFVARGDGTHVFSSTLEEHEQAVREYQLRRRDDYRSAPPAEAQ